jgi:hypothetical protein
MIHDKHSAEQTVAAGVLRPWAVDELPEPPRAGWGQWRSMVGPGLLLAGASVGAGEWLFGPAVTAQYGTTFLWIATISIVCQVFLNLEVMRYALYCGEPVVVGYFRTPPGPWFWTFVYLLMETPLIWPYMASNAAVPLAAAALGHLPGDAVATFWGFATTESHLVKILGYVIFGAAFVPLIFGGSVYKMLERVMSLKVVLVLTYLSLVALFLVSNRNIGDVFAGFFRFGAIPFRAETVIQDRHFTLTERGPTTYSIRGTIAEGQPVVTSFTAGDATYALGQPMPPEIEREMQRLLSKALALAQPRRFFVRQADGAGSITVSGDIQADDQSWVATRVVVEQNDRADEYASVDRVPDDIRPRVEALVRYQGMEQGNLFSYLFEHGGLPPLDWALLAAFASIAGAGGMSNTTFSNYARDKGWGMGAKVGAIPSAVGGLKITLSHVGKVFRINPQNMARWSGWYRHVVRDQVGVWMVCSFLGMALPCMLSLQFIRNAPVAGDRVAAMTAEGIAMNYPSYHDPLWSITLLCGFLVLAPGQIFASDSMARRWTDIVWVVNKRAQKLQGNQVKFIYYGILLAYGIWGLFALALFDPLQIAKIGGVLANMALGFTALHTLHLNRTFLPGVLRPSLFVQLGLVVCGATFLAISVVGLMGLFGVRF